MFTCLDLILIGCNRRERLYTGSGYGLIECVKALMSYEDEVSSNYFIIYGYNFPELQENLHKSNFLGCFANCFRFNVVEV